MFEGITTDKVSSCLVEGEGALLEARWGLPRVDLLFSSEPCPFLLLSGRLDHHPRCRKHSSLLIVSDLAIVSPTFVSQNVSHRDMRSTGISFQRSFLGSRQRTGDAALSAGGLPSTYKVLGLTFGAHDPSTLEVQEDHYFKTVLRAIEGV